jgi:hypothetical protein
VSHEVSIQTLNIYRFLAIDRFRAISKSLQVLWNNHAKMSGYLDILSRQFTKKNEKL